jgi:hypothetical protein
MNDRQRKLVIGALIVIGFALAFVMLQWSSQFGYRLTAALVLYRSIDPKYPSVIEEWGIYTPYGVVGLVLGVVAPLCLFAAAAFIAFGMQRSSKP